MNSSYSSSSDEDMKEAIGRRDSSEYEFDTEEAVGREVKLVGGRKREAVGGGGGAGRGGARVKKDPEGLPGGDGGKPLSKCSKDSGGGHSINLRILCRVCGDNAVRHVHYGGHCCFSCKAFFRRAVNWQNKNDRPFQCKFDRKCQITVKNRKTCQCCRFEVNYLFTTF